MTEIGTRSLAELEGELHAQLDRAIADRAEAIESLGERVDVGATATEVAELAAALRDVTAIRNSPSNRPSIAPPPDHLQAVSVHIWNRVQEAGFPTAASDAAVAAYTDAVTGAA